MAWITSLTSSQRPRKRNPRIKPPSRMPRRLIAHGDAPASRLEELVAERLLEFTHLGADGLDRHVQPLGRAGEAPLPW